MARRPQYYSKPQRIRRAVFASLVDHLRGTDFKKFTLRVHQNSFHGTMRIGCFEPGEDGKLVTMLVVNVSSPHTSGEE